MLFVTSHHVFAQSEGNPTLVSTLDTAGITRAITAGKNSNHIDSALQILSYAYNSSRALHFEKGMLVSGIELGLAYARKGQYDIALRKLEQALLLAEKYPAYLGIVHNRIGNVYNYQSDFEKAAYYYQQAALLSEKHSASVMPASYAYSNLATIMAQQKQYHKAVYYIDKAIIYARQQKDLPLLATLLLNKAVNLNNQEQRVAALIILDTAAQIARSTHNMSLLFTILINAGSINLYLEKAPTALQKLKEAEQISAKQDVSLFEQVSLYGIIGDTYLQLKAYDQAKAYLDLAWEHAETIPKEKMFLLAKKSELAHALGNDQQAYRLSQEYHRFKDSLHEQDITLQVQEMETKYRTLEKDKEIVQKQSHIADQRQQIAHKNLWIALSALTIFIILSFLVFAYIRNNNKQKLLKRNSEIERLQSVLIGEEAERQRLAQELHDGVNSQLAGAKGYLITLSQWFPEIASSEPYTKSKDIIDETAVELRRLAHNLLPNALNLGLKEAVKHFLQQIQSGTETQFEFHGYGTFGALDANQSLNIYRIIQEIVHNVLKHARATEVIILLNEYSKEYSLIIEDNGIGMPDTALQEGMGLHNIRRRVQALQGSISIESAAQKGTLFSIHIPKTNQHSSTPSNMADV
ncbi:sensor histidine kinase [Taibaiella sp. KBW10]|uniref:tetratricopeptide repeat-containing sensor histidine kinase n=1 Tax=Taibaiella sp. KBW10 TaxID=2153357 RepID=UPI0013152F6E|nr:sensor histidine kinase [Taibaiella sp. KBW10]